jgi:hypothetical protein
MKEIAAATNADWKLPDITSLKEDAQKRKAAEVEASNAERQQKTIDERVVKPTRRGIIGSFLYNRKLLRRMNKLRKLQDERDILSKKEDSGDLSAHEKSRLYSLNTLIDVNRDILNKLRNS